VPKLLPGQETRSPDDFELFLEGILEAPRGPRPICPDGRYVPAFKNGPSYDLFPCAGKGNCGNGANGGCAPGSCANGGPAPGSHASGGPAPGSCSSSACIGLSAGVTWNPAPAPATAPTTPAAARFVMPPATVEAPAAESQAPPATFPPIAPEGKD
jgi:pilus assembly protein CpaC